MMYVLVASGLVVLLVGGEILVRGAVSIAERLGLSKLVIGFTIVAFGTSAPELVVCIDAALDGHPGIAMGNIVGSNIANVLLVVGVPALILPIVCDHRSARRDGVTMIGASLVFIGLCFSGSLTRIDGVILVALLAAIIWHAYSRALKYDRKRATEAVAELEEQMPHSYWLAVSFILGGLLGLAAGSEMVVSGAVDIARAAGVSEEVIGLTLVALGTSLPELTTSIIAAAKRQGDVAIGNVIGSNIFNVLGIIGTTVIVAPITVPTTIFAFDIWVMLGVSLLLLLTILTPRPIGRTVGAVFLAGYIAYIIFQVASPHTGMIRASLY